MVERKLDRIYKGIILDLPIEYGFKEDEKLFELPPIQKKRVPRENLSHHNKFFQVTSKSKNDGLGFLTPHQTFSSKGNGNQAVVIKNIGNMTAKHLKNAIRYAMENSKDRMPLNEDFERIRVDEVLKDWSVDFNTSRENTNEAMHLVFSIQEKPSEQNMKILLHSVFDTLRENYPNYKFILISHTHQNNPHIHAIINKTNQLTLTKFHLKDKSECREFFNKLRNDFSDSLALYSQNTLSKRYVNSVNYSDFLPSKSERERLKNEPLQDPKIFNFKKLLADIQNAFVREVELKKEKLRKLREKQEKEQDEIKQEALKIEIQNVEDSLTKSYRDFSNHKIWADNFDDYFRKIPTLQRDEEILKRLEKFENHRLTQAILLEKRRLKDSVSARKIEIEKSIFPLTHFITTTLSPSIKSNAFNLYKHQRRIRRLQFLAKNYLDNAGDLKEIMENLKGREEEVKEVIKGRGALVSEMLEKEIPIFKENEKRLSSLISERRFDDGEFEVLSKDYVKSARKIRFLTKEINLIRGKNNKTNLEEINSIDQTIEESKAMIKKIDTSLKSLEKENTIKPVFATHNDMKSPSPISKEAVSENQALGTGNKIQSIRSNLQKNQTRGRR